MRNVTTVAALTFLIFVGPASAESVGNVKTMPIHSAMRNHMAHHAVGQGQHALGSVRHPTVGDTANQRVNGG